MDKDKEKFRPPASPEGEASPSTSGNGGEKVGRDKTEKKLGAAAVAGADGEKSTAPKTKTKEEVSELIRSGRLSYEQLLELYKKTNKVRRDLGELPTVEESVRAAFEKDQAERRKKEEEEARREAKKQEEEIKREVAEQEGSARIRLLEKLQSHPKFQKVMVGVLSVALAVGIGAGIFGRQKKLADSQGPSVSVSEQVEQNSADENVLSDGSRVDLSGGGSTAEAEGGAADLGGGSASETQDDANGSGNENLGGSSVAAAMGETENEDDWRELPNGLGYYAMEGENAAGETEIEDDWQQLPNGLVYNAKYYSEEYTKSKSNPNNFTTDNSDLYGNAEGLKKKLHNTLVGRPDALATYFYDLSDETKGDLAGYSSTQLHTMLMADGGDKLQVKIVGIIDNDLLKNGTTEFREGEAGEVQINSYSKSGVDPRDSLLATGEKVLKGGEKLFIIKGEKGDVVGGLLICFNNERQGDTNDGSVMIVELSEEEAKEHFGEDDGTKVKVVDYKTVKEVVDKRENQEPSDPVEPSNPVNPAEPDNPVEPSNPVNPVEPNDPDLQAKGKNTHAGENVTQLPVTPENPESGAAPVTATENNYVDAETNPGAELKADDMSEQGREGIGEAIMKAPEVTGQDIVPTYDPTLWNLQDNEVPIVGDGTSTYSEATADGGTYTVNVNEAAAAGNTQGSAEDGTRTASERADRFAELSGTAGSAAAEGDDGGAGTNGQTDNNGGNQ